MRVLVAMSGGLDSSAAAYLLRQQGHDVIGIFMRNGIHADGGNPRSCCSAMDAWDARRVADQLDIPFYAANLAEGFRDIIRYFVEEYRAGRTPTPCVLCNRDLKFGSLLDYADVLGCDAVATGHYARTEVRNGRHALLRARDLRKDQTYMLHTLTQAQLARCLFPLGSLEKSEVREIARRAGLRTAGKPESQELCFVPAGDHRELLRERLPEASRPGRFVLRDGTPVGTHPGHPNFTIGQRRGLGIALGRPVYVVEIRPETNEVVLGTAEDLDRPGMTVRDVNWISIPKLAGPTRALVRIRHAQEPREAVLSPLGADRVLVKFARPERIVTPGQSAVFYDGDLVLGGGWIESS